MPGGHGYIADHGIERFDRDMRLFRLDEGTSQTHPLNIAKQTLAAVATRPEGGLAKGGPPPNQPAQDGHSRQ